MKVDCDVTGWIQILDNRRRTTVGKIRLHMKPGLGKRCANADPVAWRLVNR
jgi:hypothetical protein